MIKCFEKISSMINEEENFIDIAFMKSQNLKEPMHKFKVGHKIIDYLKVKHYTYLYWDYRNWGTIMILVSTLSYPLMLRI